MDDLSGIKNIVFDFGNVVMDIDFQKTIDEFKSIGFKDVEQFLKDYRSLGFFSDYQEGKISDKEFISKIKEIGHLNLNNQIIIDAWNAMLLDYDLQRIDFLKKLRKKYKIYLLSNTNNLHYENFAFRVPHSNSIDELFDKTYYSHTLQQSKPSVEIYNCVMTDAKINPSESLFIDDLQENIEGAKNAGMKARIVNYPSEWTEWFSIK